MLRRSLHGLLFAAAVALPYAHDVEAETGYVPQTSDERSIRVTVVPQNIAAEAATWGFEVTMETHTRDLSDDLTQSSTLLANGQQYLPLRWEGAPPGGHHRKGILRFKAIAPRPRAMELQIRLGGDAAPRSFEWVLK